MAGQDTIVSEQLPTWKDMGLDNQMQRTLPSTPKPADFISGANFDALLDELTFNRMIRLKDLREIPQGNDPGKIYWDGENKKYKIWVNGGGWCDVIYTSTSTSTTSSSSSSSSTSSTSSSTSSTSTSSTSSSSSSTSTSTS